MQKESLKYNETELPLYGILTKLKKVESRLTNQLDRIVKIEDNLNDIRIKYNVENSRFKTV